MTPDAMAQLHAQAFQATRPWNAAEFASLLAQPGTIWSGDMRAFVLARVTIDEAEILTLATHPQHRRKGLAAAELAKCEDALRENGAVTVFLEVAEDNVAAIALYHRAGYAQVGVRPNYYAAKDGPPIAALVLKKQLIAV